MSEQNFKNRTLMHGDNLDFLRSMNTRTVDLVATDPPFNKNKDFHATPNSRFEGASFQDRWTWDDAQEEWIDKITDDFPNLMNVIKSSRKSYGDDMGGFLCFMSIRILEMWRVLKDTGSMYLHCDPTASHYLKMVMDSIFGKKNFLNEIIWYYRGAGVPKQKYAKRHDVILWYSKSENYYFNPDPARQSYAEATVERFKHHIGNVRDGIDYGEQELNEKGKHPDDVFTDIQPIAPSARIRLGSPTQKPLELYKRIIETSSKKGDVILDPFAGCATTCVAAEKLGRKWVGIDIWDEAHEMVIKHLENEGMLSTNGRKRRDILVTRGDITYRKRILKRTDDGEDAVSYLEPTLKQYDKREKDPYTNEQKKELLGRHCGLCCQGCGRILPSRYLQIDHMNPRSAGGSNLIKNRILLCYPCNNLKSNKLTLPGLRSEVKKRDWITNEKNIMDLKKLVGILESI